MSVWWLACRQSVFQRYHSEKNIYQSLTHKMALKLRHCYPVYTNWAAFARRRGQNISLSLTKASKCHHIATSTVHSKLDYCNTFYHNLPKCQITRLQQIQNSFALGVVKAAKSSHITPILRSLHGLTITERTEYKLLSLTSTPSSLRITDRSFQYASPCLWNQPPASLRQPRTNLSNSASPSSLSGTFSISSTDSPLSSSITPSLFYSRLKTFLFCKSFLP